MRYRTLGDGLEVSAIGIGCMPMVEGGNINYGGNADADTALRTIHRAIDLGVSATLSPLALVVFNVGFFALAYPAGSLSDRMSSRTILMAGMGVLIAANLLLAQDLGIAGLGVGILLWGAHMALTQGIFARMIADVAPDHLRATSFGAFHFVSGIGTLLASVAAGFIWDRDGAATTFLAGAVAAGVALAMLSLLPEPRPDPDR